MADENQSRESMLREVVAGVWVASEPVRIMGTKLTTNMTVLRLRSGDLLLHSPVPMTADRRAAVEKLGRVAHLYAPNTFHHTWIGEWSRFLAPVLTASGHEPRLRKLSESAQLRRSWRNAPARSDHQCHR